MRGVVAGVVLGVLFVVGGPEWARAAAADYPFELIGGPVPQGKQAVISVRLVHKPSGAPVDDAVIFQQRLDMAPDVMADMISPLTALPPAKPGIYQFKGDLDMAGRWALKLAAKVPGEQETVRGEVIVTAK